MLGVSTIFSNQRLSVFVHEKITQVMARSHVHCSYFMSEHNECGVWASIFARKRAVRQAETAK